jgi:hypothetical protein
MNVARASLVLLLPLLLLRVAVACGAPDAASGGEGSPEAAAALSDRAADLGAAATDTLPPPAVVVQGGSDIWVAPLSGDGAPELRLGEAANLTARPDRYDNQPQFLAGGDALLYTAGDAEGRTDIHRLDADGRSEQLTRTPVESEFSPTPLPDGGFAVIRVEADGTQRLWRFEADGTDPTLLLPDLAPVGYQGWIDAHRVALFVLGDPATLRVAHVGTGEVELVFEGIGSSVQAIPGRRAVSFVEVDGEGDWIREYDGDSGQTARIVRLPEGAGGDHAWTPGGTLLVTAGARVLAHYPGATAEATAQATAESTAESTEWTEVGAPGPDGVTWSRIAVSPHGTLVALVGQREGEE